MCYQMFITFTCGCGTLKVDEPCEYSTHPFGIRYLCPNYSSDSDWSIHACGPGDWWCAQSKDAEYILNLFRLCRATGAKCEHLDKEQHQLKQRLQNLQADAQQRGVSEHVFKRHPEVNRLNLRYSANAEQHNELVVRGKTVVTFIEEVKQFYGRFGGPHSQHRAFSKAPSFVDTVGPRVTRSVSSVLLSTNRSATPTQFPVGDSPIGKERVSSLLSQQAIKQGEQIPQPRGRTHQKTKQATPAKRKRKSLSAAKTEVEDEKPTVRRSTRVSNKKINYEETDGSSPTRAVSPGESDVSGFNPSNGSDISASPEKSPPKRRRGNPALQSQSSSGGAAKLGAIASSFSDKINEYRELLSRTSSPGNAQIRPQPAPTPGEKTSQRDNPLFRPPEPYQIPQVARAFQNLARPPTRHGPPNHQQVNSSISNFAPLPATPNFLSNQQTPQSAPLQSLLPTNNFFFQGGPPSSTLYAQRDSAQSNYDRLRLSFGATADLTPPATTNTTPPTTDPKKRKQPVSSPLQSTNKSLRLSFPGDDLTNDAPTLLNQAPPRSSPSIMQATATTDPSPGEMYKERDKQLPAPAPNLVPTAVMYQPSLRPDQTMFSTVTNGGQETQAGGFDDRYDDDLFDELIEEDKFSTELPDSIFG